MDMAWVIVRPLGEGLEAAKDRIKLFFSLFGKGIWGPRPRRRQAGEQKHY